MIDPKLAREQHTHVMDALRSRNEKWEPLFTHYIQLDTEWRENLQDLDRLKSERNQAPKGKPTSEELTRLKSLSDQIKGLQDKVNSLESALQDLALSLPNIPDASVPLGTDDSQNVVIKTVGTPTQFPFTPLSHDELGKRLGGLDFETASKITGARFVVYRKWGARLARALAQFMLDIHTRAHGYEEISPPFMVNSQSLTTTGQLPKFADEAFQIAQSDYWLSPTAEVQLTNMYRDTILSDQDLPLCLTAYTPCFRREAGSYGKDMNGLIRHHQFDKVELVRFVEPSTSMAQLDLLLTHAETVLQQLQLPYQVLSLCRGDLGFSSAKTYDLEVWLPAQDKYREISSCSNFLDFQSRRGMIRYKDTQTGRVAYLHTLNGSGLAVGRTMAAVLENYQQSDGRVKVPEVLIPYMGVDILG